MSKNSRLCPSFIQAALWSGAAIALGAFGCVSDPDDTPLGVAGASTSTSGSSSVAGTAASNPVAGSGSLGSAGTAAGGSLSANAGAGGGGGGFSAGGASAGGGGASSGGAGGASAGGGNGGAGGSGGVAGSGSPGGSSGAGGAGTDCSTLALCDGFEGDAPGMGKSPWKVTQGNGYSVVVDTTQAHGGTHAVHISAPTGAGSGVLRETSTFPAADSWGRAYMRFKAASGGHQMFIAVLVQGGDQFRLLNTLGSDKIQLNEQNGDKFFPSSTTVPMEKWFCYEWHVTATSAAVYLDGKQLTDATPTGWSVNNAQSLQIGYQRFQAGPSAGEIWLDDVAVSDKQIGCQ